MNNTQALTAKELSALEDELTAEQQLVKKYQMYAQMVSDPQLRTACEQIACKHQHHFDSLTALLK